jgi:prepilin-type N-terminal cleavage/methylation domain-containing protein
MKKGFTLTELLVAIGLLAGVLTASTIIFHYSIEAQRTAMATAEIMRNVRAITDQLNSNLTSLKADGYLLLYSDEISPGRDANHNDALYFFSDGDFQSSQYEDLRSNVARIYFGHARNDYNDLLLDMRLLTPDSSKVGDDSNDFHKISFVECQSDIKPLEIGKDPNDVLKLNGSRPIFDANYPSNLLAQRVKNLRIEWTYNSDKWTSARKTIEWYGFGHTRGVASFETSSSPYIAVWTPRNQADWPKALKFTFTLHDSKKILKGGRTFEHIVYIGK